MGYTRENILFQCQKAFQNKNTFYKKGIVNYRGKTTDTAEYYTEIIAEFLCENIIEYTNGIKCISRKASYKVKGHDGKYNPASNRDEEKIAMQMFTQSKENGPFDYIGNRSYFLWQSIQKKMVIKNSDCEKVNLIHKYDKIVRN